MFLGHPSHEDLRFHIGKDGFGIAKLMGEFFFGPLGVDEGMANFMDSRCGDATFGFGNHMVFVGRCAIIDHIARANGARPKAWEFGLVFGQV